jgi:hypothetical protein
VFHSPEQARASIRSNSRPRRTAVPSLHRESGVHFLAYGHARVQRPDRRHHGTVGRGRA